MLQHLRFICLILLLCACSSGPDTQMQNTVNQPAKVSQNTTLSHIRAYLLIGNVDRAAQLFQSLDQSNLTSQGQILLAEIHAAQGDSVAAQQVFLSALANTQSGAGLASASIPSDLLDYFCTEKKWPALEGYGQAMLNTASDVNKSAIAGVKNKVLTNIGLCFFNQQQWQKSAEWLSHVELNEQVNPLAYLALARANIALQKPNEAQRYINQYKQSKNKIDADALWAEIQVYVALNQPDKAIEIGEVLRTLFGFNEATRKYILLTKRGILAPPSTSKPVITQPSVPNTAPAVAQPNAAATIEYNSIHTIQKGETLYRISKLYGLTTAELQAWNPELDVHDIPIGTQIRVMPQR